MPGYDDRRPFMPSLSLPILLMVVAGPAAPERPPDEETTGPGPAGNLGPIRYFGTAWATIGLVRSSPRNAEKAN
jgi:hypothetical protein